MLTLFFKKALTREQDEHLFDELKEFPQRYEYDVSESIDTRVDVYTDDDELSQEIAKKLTSLGFDFTAKIGPPTPIFCSEFGDPHESKPSLMEIDEIRTEMVRERPEGPVFEAENECLEQFTPATPSSEQQHEQKPQMRRIHAGNDDSESRFVTADQFTLLAKKAEAEMSRFATEIMKKMSSSWTPPPAAPLTSSYPSAGTSSSSETPKSIRHVAKSAEFVAKNELIANGIRCEKCQTVIRGVSPITQLMNAVRDHVILHFDSENPNMKRYECRECKPEFRTNFVDDFEKHVKKHGTMSSAAEMRHKYTRHMMSEKQLKTICKTANACFPEVFEKVPPALGTILQIDTPSRAKSSVFPRLDRLYCAKYNIPATCNTRVSGPIPVVKLN